MLMHYRKGEYQDTFAWFSRKATDYTQGNGLILYSIRLWRYCLFDSLDSSKTGCLAPMIAPCMLPTTKNW